MNRAMFLVLLSCTSADAGNCSRSYYSSNISSYCVDPCQNITNYCVDPCYVYCQPQLNTETTYKTIQKDKDDSESKTTPLKPIPDPVISPPEETEEDLILPPDEVRNLFKSGFQLVFDESIRSMEWVKIKTNSGVYSAPVINGLMPQFKNNTIKYDLRIPYSDYHRINYAKNGIINYVRAESVYAEYLRRSSHEKLVSEQ